MSCGDGLGVERIVYWVSSWGRIGCGLGSGSEGRGEEEGSRARNGIVDLFVSTLKFMSGVAGVED